MYFVILKTYLTIVCILANIYLILFTRNTESGLAIINK